MGRHQDNRRTARHGAGQRFDGQQHMVHDAEPVRADDDGNCAQGNNQVARIEVLTQRAEQTASAFHQHDVKSPLNPSDMIDHVRQFDPPVFPSRGEERRERGTEMPGIDLIQG